MYQIGDKIKFPNGELEYLDNQQWRCYCGAIFFCLPKRIKNGNTKSCGCFKRESLKKRLSNNNNYYLITIIKHIKDRCFNVKNNDYRNYGGRGISVQNSWIESNKNFVIDILNTIGHKPTLKHQLNRIDNNGNYEISNVEWADPISNARNKRNNVIIKINDEEKTLVEWADVSNIPYDTLRNRIKRGVTSDKLLSKRNVKKNKFNPIDLYNIWYHIKERTLKPDCDIYYRYGGRGISIFAAWGNSYSSFKNDIFNEIGVRPSRLHQLDRIDNNGNYQPGNIRWVISSENCRNKQNNISIEINGEKKLVVDLAKEYNFSYILLIQRLKRMKDNLSIQKLLSPIQKRKFDENTANCIRDKNTKGASINSLSIEYNVGCDLILDVIHARKAYTERK